MNIIKPSRRIKEQIGKATSVVNDVVETNKDDCIVDANIEAFSTDFEAKSKTVSAAKERARNRKQSTSASEVDIKDELDSKSDYKALMHKAIYILSIREHSVLELEEKLKAKSDDVDTVSTVMEFLLDNDYVSDTRFAEAFVRSRANKGQGPVKIRTDLRAKGVSAPLIDEYLDLGSTVWFDNAEALYKKKYGDEPVSGYNTWSKRARFLQGRGFTMEHIHSTVPQVDYE